MCTVCKVLSCQWRAAAIFTDGNVCRFQKPRAAVSNESYLTTMLRMQINGAGDVIDIGDMTASDLLWDCIIGVWLTIALLSDDTDEQCVPCIWGHTPLTWRQLVACGAPEFVFYFFDRFDVCRWRYAWFVEFYSYWFHDGLWTVV